MDSPERFNFHCFGECKVSKKFQYLYAIALPVGFGLAASPATAQNADQAAASAPVQVQELVVTSRRREEAVQTVPIAITALSGAALKAQQLNGGQDLMLAVPNMTFTRAAFGATDYQIRGIGYQVVATAADAGVGVDENNAPLVVNRLADADFYDVQRVEVQRGPQGTLYGRNATGGVIDTITNKPSDRFDASVTANLGNYDSRQFQGFINLPLSPMFKLRIAGDSLNHDGFKTNSATGHDIDGRDLYSTRVTLAFEPSTRFKSSLMWERFKEDDSRFAEKFVCSKDTGPASVGGVAVTSAIARGFLSRGCLQTSIYSQSAQTGTVNTMATLAGAAGYLYGLLPGDVNANSQSADRRTVAEGIDPTYKATNNLYVFNNEWQLSDALKLTSLTAYSEDRLETRARFEDASIPFNNTVVTPGGVFADPQTGSSNLLNLDEDYDNYSAKQFTQELRLQSSFDGPLNFNLGAFYMHLKRLDEIYIFSNGFTAVTMISNLLGGKAYVDPNATPNGEGHNYFLSRNPYTLSSTAAFGEAYWQPSETVRVTAGLRYTNDRKTFVDYPVQALADGKGYPTDLITQRAHFGEVTGRLNVDWRPRVSFTDATMVYGSFSRGYKAGGFNAPNIVAVTPTYAPEYVNAFEVGTKNTLLDRRLTLNLTGFYYDYSGYQISQVIGLNEETNNVNAKIYGLELETAWAPTRNLRFNAQAGYLHTSIKDGASIDIFNRTAGDPSLTYLKALSSACVGPTSGVAALVALVNSGALPAAILTRTCPTAAAPNGAYASSDPTVNPLAAFGVILPTSGGVPIRLKGKQLPNAPSFTVSVGAQYGVDLGADWRATLRGDVYYQGKAYTDIYNDPANQLRAWKNANASLTFESPKRQLSLQIYCRNLFDSSPITGVGVDSESLGMSRSIVQLDPRQYGVSISKRF
jgi:outer membrane receptor protein involved in Fe transport